MLSSKLKSEIRRLWDAFWSGGIANPLTAIEQISYLIFLKRLEDFGAPLLDGPAGEKYRWSYIKSLKDEDRLRHLRDSVFKWLRDLDSDRMRDAVCVIESPNLLDKAVHILDGLFIPERNQDTLGDLYEMLLSEIAESGKNGQFRTPRHIIRAMCDIVDPQLGERICDPACGTAGFLINAYQHILKCHTSKDKLKFASDGTPIDAIGDRLTEEQLRELRRNHFYGFDFDRTMVRLGWMNMIQHGIDVPEIHYADTLGSRFNERLLPIGDDLHESFDVVLANPSFAGSIDKSNIGASLQDLSTTEQNISTTRTELLFIELFLQLLKPGGRAAIIVPEGLLFGSTRAHRTLREKLVTMNQLKAVISLPSGVFQPYSGVKTSILVFTKGAKTQHVWFYGLEADGYSLNARRTEQLAQNDLWDMTLKYRLHFGASPPAFIDGQTWEAWQKLTEDDQHKRYIKPNFSIRQQEDEEGEAVSLELLDRWETVDVDEVKDWQATTGEVADNDYNLTAGRYKPFEVERVDYDPPSQIIAELQNLENHIQEGLYRLLSMVENTDEN